jgi:hypothetical protein
MKIEHGKSFSRRALAPEVCLSDAPAAAQNPIWRIEPAVGPAFVVIVRCAVARMSEAISGYDVAPSSPPPGHPDYDRTNERTKKKDAERRKTQTVSTATGVAARTLQGALAFRRSTAALASGLTHPEVRSRTMFRGADAFGGGGFPPAPAPVAASTSRAGHQCRQTDVRNRPGTACKAARGHRPRPMIRLASGPSPSPKRGLFLIINGDKVKEKVTKAMIRCLGNGAVD